MFIVFVVVPNGNSVAIVRSFEEEIFPAVIETAPIVFIVGSKFILPEAIIKAPTLNLEFKDPLNLLPPPKVKALLDISFCIFTELLRMFISMLLVKLPDMLIKLGVLMVSDPTASSLPARSIEVKLEPDKSRLGVALEVIEPVSAKFPTMVKVFPTTLSQFTLLLDTNDKLDIVEFTKDIGACPVLVTYTFGLLVAKNEAVIGPTPLPPRYTKEAVCTVSNVRVLCAVALPVTYMAVSGGIKLKSALVFEYKIPVPV